MKILIAGAGKVGHTLTRELTADGNAVTVIDQKQDILSQCCEQYDAMGVQGNCASMSVLKEAGAGSADLLIAVTDADEINLLSCATARKINPQIHTIARIRDPEYRAQVFEMQDVFGLSMIINPEGAAATEIEHLLKYPGFLKRDSFARGLVEIVELKVEPGNILDGLCLKDFPAAVKCRVLVCAVLRGGSVIMPGGSFTLEAGDRIFVTAPLYNITLLLRNLEIITRKVKRVVICGGGRITYYLVQNLEKSGINAQVIEKDRDRCMTLAKLLPDTAVICGDITDPTILEREGIDSCDALVTLTGMDELNVLVSLYGKSLNIPQIITKQDRSEEINNIVSGLSLGSIISPKELCCNGILRYVRSMRDTTGETAITVQHIADGKAEASEFIINEEALHRGEPLKDLNFKKDVLIAAISRRGRIEIPAGASSFDVGDSVIVISAGDKAVVRFNDIFA